MSRRRRRSSPQPWERHMIPKLDPSLNSVAVVFTDGGRSILSTAATVVNGQDTSELDVDAAAALRRIRSYPSTAATVVNGQDTADSELDVEEMVCDAVLHTREQRKTASDHVEMLKKEGKQVLPVVCTDTSWFAKTDMGKLSSLHLIVDTRMYRILMDNGRLRNTVYSKFKELDDCGKRIYVLNTLTKEFNELYHQIPRNALIMLNQEHPTGQSNEGDATKISGMTGGQSKDSIVTGTVDGNQCNVYGTYLNVNTGRNYEISSTVIGDKKNGPSITIGQGTQASSNNQLVVTINHAENNQEIFDEVTSKKERLLTGPVREVETEIGSVIIKLTVDKTHIMTDAWIQTVLKTIFYDILRVFFTVGTTFQVTVDRQICIGEEEFLKLYSSHQSHDDCVPKTEFDSLKSKLEAMVSNTEDCSSKEEREKSIAIKQEPFDEELFEGKLSEENPLERKPLDGQLLKVKSFQEKSFEGMSFEEKTMKRKLYDENPFETFHSFKMMKFPKMYKGDPDIDMKNMEIDHLMAEIYSLQAELDYVRENQMFKTENVQIAPRGRTRRKEIPKILDYEDALMDPGQKVIFQKAYDTCLQQTLQDLITSGSLDINYRKEKGMSLVMASALNGEKDLFDLLVKNGCSLSDRLANDDNILHLACLGGNVDIVNFILTNNIADIESRGMYGRTPVMKAAGAGQKEVFELLVSKGCNLNAVGTDYNKLLHVACMGDNVQIVAFLIEKVHADIESRGMYGRTPVMIAASLGKKNVFNLLVRHGCDLSVEGADRNNLLHVACMSDCSWIVHFLISKKQADMESREIYGKTPVMIAAERGNRQVFDLLVRKGCDLHVEDHHGNNILHAAVKGGNLQIVNDLLLEVQLDPQSKNDFGQTAYSLAVAQSRDQLYLRDS